MKRFFLTPFHGLVAALLAASAAFMVYLRGQPARSLARREGEWKIHIEPGDLIFQDLDCGLRCDLIRQITRSPYTHVGIVMENAQHQREVWEALAPVGPTPLVDFVERGRDRLLAIYRLEPSLRAQLPQILDQVGAMAGKPYDPDYQWDDDRIYCSELIEKAVQRATGVQLAPPHPGGPGSFGRYKGTISRITDGGLTEQTPLTAPIDLTRSTHVVRLVDELEHSQSDAGIAP